MRLISLVQLSLAVLAAFGLGAWLANVRLRLRPALFGAVRWLPAMIVAGVLFLSRPTAGITLAPMNVPPVYSAVAADPSLRVICNLPISDKLQIGNWYMYWQTVHGRKMVNGYLVHHSRTSRQLLDRIAVWEHFGQAQTEELVAAGIDAVVYHDRYQESQLIRLRDVSLEQPPDGEPPIGN